MKLRQSLFWSTKTYQPGDIVGVTPTGWSILEARASQAVFTPHTPLLHWFFIGKYIAAERDYVIYESIPSHGVAIGRLSFYDGQKYKVFRINRTEPELGEAIIDEVSLFGRKTYGYMSILKMLPAIIAIEWLNWKLTKKLRAITASAMYAHMSSTGELCTQLVHDVPKKLGVDILCPGDAALPCAFINAVNEGLLIEVTQGVSV